MSIKRMELTGLTAFERATFEFVPGINVLLGANSTGKTHALKWLYASVKALELPVLKGEVAPERIFRKVPAVFLPEERRIGRMRRHGESTSLASVAIDGDEGAIGYSLTSGDGMSARGDLRWKATAPTVFLPSREVLALYEGFVAAYTNRELSIDETYFDACVALNASLLRGPRAEVAKPFVESVEALLGGKVELVGERFYVTFNEAPSTRLEAHLVAEGLRKIASIVRLLQNGSIAPGGLLIWDEPEANLNPRLVAALVPILEALAKAGVQIVLATHDYILTKRLSLISEADSPDRPPVKFFLLSRAQAGAPVEVTSARTLIELPRTPMDEEFLRLYDDEVKAFRGE
ncbi:MAG: AAA family ATPase [Rhodoglobus sp.]|nr:AAA family ATPase [Rhodoglobus sp.]